MHFLPNLLHHPHWIVVFLTQDHPHNREHFGTLAACSLFIVDAMRCHLDYHIIAEWGCLAMANLAVDSPTNIFNLDSVGAAATVYGAIMTHNVVQGVLIAACKAIVLLTKNPSFLGRIKLLGMGEKLQNILESEKSGRTSGPPSIALRTTLNYIHLLYPN